MKKLSATTLRPSWQYRRKSNTRGAVIAIFEDFIHAEEASREEEGKELLDDKTKSNMQKRWLERNEVVKANKERKGRSRQMFQLLAITRRGVPDVKRAKGKRDDK